ncbi:MAG: transposase [Arcicella sp.]|jgi:transposase|nr:transposase [Arcicella sp.]
METQYYGIDISKNKLQIAYQDATTQVWSDFQIDNEITSITLFLSSIEQPNIHFIYEYTGSYTHRLTYCLSVKDLPFSIVSPQQSKGFSLSLKNSSKTDKSDARMLFLYGQKMQPALTIIEDIDLHHKRQTYNYLLSLKADKQAFENRKHALAYDPRASKSVLDSIEMVLGTLTQQIQIIEDEIFTISDDDNQRIQTLMNSVVGIGKASSEAIMIATNGLKNFQNVKQLAKFLGVCATDKRSGSSVFGKPSIVKSGHSFVRTTLYMAARSAKKYNNACKEIYLRLRENGKAHKVAMMAVVHKLLKQVFAVVKSQIPFDNLYATPK